jgi:cytochrome c5
MARSRWTLALCVGAGLVACARLSLPAATPADVERAQTRWPGTTTAELEQGRALYRGRCTSCHQPVAPWRIGADEWPGHVAEMQDRSGLSEAEAELVLRYVVTMADRGPP